MGTGARLEAGQRPAEDRRLKAAGLLLVVVGGAGLVLLAEHAGARWPLAMERLLPFAAGVLLAVNLAAVGLLVLAAGCGSAAAMRRRAWRRAIVLQLLLVNAIAPFLMFWVVQNSTRASGSADDWEAAAALVFYACGIVSSRIWRRSRQQEAPDAAEAMRRDPRPPVLYLRSFRDDDEAVLDDGSGLKRRAMQLARRATPEEELADILDRAGPLVAIGKPGEPLPELGAARLYVAHDQWQQRVMALMAQAQLVVVRVGTSPGVLWEIEQALATLPRQRLVLVILGRGAVAPELVARLEPVLGPTFRAALPQPSPPGWKTLWFNDPRRRLGALVGFAADGTAFAVPVRAWPISMQDVFLYLLVRLSAPPLRYAWRRMFERLGVPWLDSARRRSRVLAVLLAAGLGWFGAHWFYLGNTRRGRRYLVFFPVLLPIILGIIDAVRFIWADRQEFESRFVTLRSPDPAAHLVAQNATTP